MSSTQTVLEIKLELHKARMAMAQVHQAFQKLSTDPKWTLLFTETYKDGIPLSIDKSLKYLYYLVESALHLQEEQDLEGQVNKIPGPETEEVQVSDPESEEDLPDLSPDPEDEPYFNRDALFFLKLTEEDMKQGPVVPNKIQS